MTKKQSRTRGAPPRNASLAKATAAPKRTVKADENAILWQMLETAWAEAAPRLHPVRDKMAAGNASESDFEQVSAVLDDVIAAFEEALGKLDEPRLLEVDRALERALFKIDRAEIQQVTGGSPEGFMYARGFIVALGKPYFDAVDDDPDVAMADIECEAICYLPFHVYEDKFGEPPEDDESGISRETRSNSEAWPED